MAKKKTKKKAAGKTSRTATTRGRKASTRSTGAKKKAAAKKRPTKKTTKKTAKKTTRKKTTAKKSSKKKTAARSTRKTASKKKTTKKTAKASARKSSTKKTTKKSTTKKSTKKKTTKKATAKRTAKKTGAKKTTTKKTAATAKKTSKKKAAGKKKRGKKKVLGARSVAEAASAAEADAQGYVYVNGRRVRMISTGGQGVVKKTRSTRKTSTEEELPTAPEKTIKTKLTAKELRHYRELLLEKRAELVGDVASMENAALQAHGGNLSNLPIHMADIGSDTYDQDFMLGLAETERKQLHEIDGALMRIADKTYGICQMTGKPIPKTRLNAKPWAKYTIEAARMLEGQWRA